MSANTIAVTGCYGHVGTYVCERLLEEGFTVLGMDIRQFKKHQLHSNENFFPVQLDLADSDSIQQVFSELSSEYTIDVLIHIAFIIPPGTSKNPELSYKVNVEGSRTIFDTMRSHNSDGHIIFTSSIATLTPQPLEAEPVGFPPQNAEKATTTYGNHKIEVENYLHTDFNDYSWTICKLASVLIPEKYLTVNKDEVAYSKTYLPWDTKAQSVHVRNVAEAFTRISADYSSFDKKVYLLAGHHEDRMLFADFIAAVINKLTGVQVEITREKVKEIYQSSNRYYMHWYDVETTNKDLNYLHYNFDDFLNEIDEKAGLTVKISRRINGVLFRLSPRYAKWFLNLVL